MNILKLFQRGPSRADKNLMDMYRAALASSNARYVLRVLKAIGAQWGDGARYWKLQKHYFNNILGYVPRDFPVPGPDVPSEKKEDDEEEWDT